VETALWSQRWQLLPGRMSVKLNAGKAEWEKYENNPEPIHWASALGDHLAVRCV